MYMAVWTAVRASPTNTRVDDVCGPNDLRWLREGYLGVSEQG